MARVSTAPSTRVSPPRRGSRREFNSLDARREACEAYITSQKYAGWAALPDHYDDGGLSGGTMERPALQRLLSQELDRLGVVSKRRDGAGGVLAGGNRFSRGALYTLLQNPIYRGEIGHQGKVYPGQHDAIIDAELWQFAHEKLAGNRQARALGETAVEPSLLAGLIVDGDGQRMTPTHAVKKDRRYRYYASTQLISGTRSDHAKGWRIPTGDIEVLVLDRLRAFLASDRDLGEPLSSFDLDASAVRSAMAKASQHIKGWASLPPIKVRELVRTVVETITVDDEKVVASLKPREIATILLGDTCNLPEARQHTAIELTIDAKLRRAGKGIRLVVGGGVAERPDGQMIALLRDAHATREALMSGRDETIDAMSRRLGIDRDILSAQMRLTYLAPDIVRALVLARSVDGLTPAGLLSSCKDLPHDWQSQRAALDLETP